jgi:CBS domain-containing protein
MAIHRKLISDVMNRSVYAVGVEKPASEALRMMQEHRVSSILVLDAGMILGIITERDIVRAWARDHEIARDSCADLMQSPVVTVTAGTRCLDAYHMMASRGLRHLAVTDDAGQVVGMVSEGDVMRNYGLEYYMNFKDVASVMNGEFCRLPPSAPVSEALKQMIQLHQSCVVAVDDKGKPLGVLSERDAVRLCRLEAQPEKMSLGAAMVSPVVTVKPRKRLHVAVKFMEQNRIRRLVVVDERGVACGLLTHHEVARGLEGDYVQYLKDIIELQKNTNSFIGQERSIDERLVLANILRSVTGTAFVASDLDFRISFATPLAAELLGLKATDIDGADLRDALKRAGWKDAHESLPAQRLRDAGARRFMVETSGGPTAIQVTVMVDARNDPQGYLVLAQRS